MLKAYSAYFTAFLLSNLKDTQNIERIVLYGSVGKGEETKESDIDIFIEVKNKTKKLERDVKNIENNFYSSREASLFKLKDIQNKLSVKLGILKEWKDLYKSIASTGIILYGPYEAKELPSGVKHNIIVFWDGIEKNRGAFLNKVYGFKTRNKYYPGLLAKLGGKKIGKSCIMLPIGYKKELFRLINEHKVNAKVLEVFI